MQKTLNELIGRQFFLSPKDPDPYPAFYIHNVDPDSPFVAFHKGSSGHVLEVDLRKIAAIDPHLDGERVDVRLLGRVVFEERKPLTHSIWKFLPTGAVGRPRKAT